MTKTITTAVELQEALKGKNVGTVFTMGALHAGHAELMNRCRQEIGSEGVLVVTVFVNPTQFNDKDDFENYPRDLASDVEFCSKNSVDYVFVPEVSEVYPVDDKVRNIEPGALASELEGKSRPGHFAGVTTVVHRLIELTKPQVTCFGEKDFQQLTIVREMVRRENLALKVIGVETVRENDGLAMSSRNKRLSSDQRKIAPKLYEAMEMVNASLASGILISESVESAKKWLNQFEQIELDYLTVLSDQLTAPRPGLARILIAAKIGDVRLIDNRGCILEAVNV